MDVRLLVRGQAVVGEGQDVGAERIADQDHVRPRPGRTVVGHDGGEVGGGLLGRLLGPEIAQAVDTHDRDPVGLEPARDVLVDVAPAAVAGIDHRHLPPCAGHGQLDQRQAGEAAIRLRGQRGLEQLGQASAQLAAGRGQHHRIVGGARRSGERPRRRFIARPPAPRATSRGGGWGHS